jgi:error-prone DNA polymerase
MPSVPEYVELHCHSNYSFQEGASRLDELVFQALDLGYRALALTDHDNLVGAMAFGQATIPTALKPITGVELTLHGGAHLTLLAATPQGYGNLCRLVSDAHFQGGRTTPALNARNLAERADGIIVLSGCKNGEVPRLLMEDRWAEARRVARQYREWFGDRFYLELQHNLVHGDTDRVRCLVRLGQETGIPVVATNNVHYHTPDRRRLHDCLVASKRRLSLEQARRYLWPNAERYLKSPEQMAILFRQLPEAIRNTLAIAARCEFNVTRDLNYRFPDYAVPEGFTPITYLEYVCRDAAMRRYEAIDERIEARLREELRLVQRHNLAGFFLLYRDLVQVAHEVQIDLGLIHPETPVEVSPPGRGRGSSVVMLLGYLIGLSHIDPLVYNLSLERFLPDEDLAGPPDIDIDFPRNIREETIKRVHEKWGWEHAALTAMVATYQAKGAIRDLGLALGLPPEEVNKLAKRVEHSPASSLKLEMAALPEFRNKVDAPGWRELIDLAGQLDGFPHVLAQHPGGMVISSTPLVEAVPVQPSAIEGRYIVHWDKDSIDDARMVKIDFLALGALSQMQRAVRLIEERTGEPYDLSRIAFDDPMVYDMIARADTDGVFQIESAAQKQTTPRLNPRNLMDMAHQVAAVRPGVGANNGVAIYLRRRLGQAPVEYDHPLEKAALERTLGVILFQDQVNRLAMDVAGFSAVEADQLRRAFQKRGNERVVLKWWDRFWAGAQAKGVDFESAKRVYSKFNAGYMFPEAHAVAFGVTAFQMAHLKYYFPLEFYTALFNEQPMGFYDIESLKEDARRHGVRILNPDVNRSDALCIIDTEAIRLGLAHVKEVGSDVAETILSERAESGAFQSVGDLMQRVSLSQRIWDSLADAGALDSLTQGDRRGVRWEIGLRHIPTKRQRGFVFATAPDTPDLPAETSHERMEGEYASMNIHPDSHLMAYTDLPRDVVLSSQLEGMKDGARVRVAGRVIRRQSPLANAVFITLEDTEGQVPCVVWRTIYTRFREQFREPVLIAGGTISRREGTMLVVIDSVKPLNVSQRVKLPSKDWG